MWVVRGLLIVFILSVSASTFCAEDRSLCIVALGDSTTAGTPGFRSPIESPPRGKGNVQSQYTHWVEQRHPEWKILNRGVNAERTDQIHARIRRHVIDEGADIAVVMAGVNDLYQGHSADQVKAGLVQIYRTLDQSGIKVIACTILPFNIATATVRGNMAKVNVWIKAYAQKEGFGFCDTYQSAVDPESLGQLRGSPDDIHPDVGTYKLIGEAINLSLEDLLSSSIRSKEI